MDEIRMHEWVDVVLAAYLEDPPPPPGIVPVILLNAYRSTKFRPSELRGNSHSWWMHWVVAADKERRDGEVSLFMLFLLVV